MTPSSYTTLSNAQFLLAEGSLVAQALIEGAGWPELRRAAQEGRLFGSGKSNSQRTVLDALRARFRDIPGEVLPELAAGTLEARRLLMLGLVTRQKPLLRDFVEQVLLRQWQRLDPRVTDAEARAFLSHQAEQRPEVAAWSPATLQKTRGNLTRFLVDAGLLHQRGPGEFQILPQYPSPQVRLALRELDPHLAALLEKLK